MRAKRTATPARPPERTTPPSYFTWDGTTAGWRAHLEAIEATRFVPRDAGYLQRINRCEEPGYYVSAMGDAGRGDRMLVEGPFVTHVEALVAVWAVSQAWGTIDPRACWYAWGTARVKEEEAARATYAARGAT